MTGKRATGRNAASVPTTTHPHRLVSRRTVLIGGVATAASVGVAGALSTIGPADAATTTSGTTCSSATYTPEVTEGPYWVDTKLNRSDITANSDGTNQQDGVALTLDLTFVDSACTPVTGAYIDIWHCNAAGVYSDESSEGTAGQTWLRGYQVTDADGSVSFVTVYPGWYAGRTIHIHMRVRTYSGTTEVINYTTQLFFVETDNASVMSAYASKDKQQRTYNSSDSIYGEEQDEGGAVLVGLTGNSADGYTGALTLQFNTTSGSGSGSGSGGTRPTGAPGNGTPPARPTGTPTSGTSSSGTSSSGTSSSTGTTTATPTTTPVDRTVSAHILSVKRRRRHGHRQIVVEWVAGETVTGRVSAKLKGHRIGLIAKRSYAKGRHTTVLTLSNSVGHGTGAVYLDLTDRAGNTRQLTRHVVIRKQG